MTDELAIVEVAEPMTESTETFVMARNQQEMQAAQTQLVSWANGRVGRALAEVADAETNLAAARQAKWKSGPFERLVRLAKDRVHFYDKLKLALEAGYVIVPDMAMDVFAIRTTRGTPTKNLSKWGWPREQASNAPPAGEGRYVDPTAFNQSRRVTETDPSGKPSTHTERWAVSFDETIDFPFKLAKVQVLNATAEAAALKIFDEMGVAPATRAKGDPMVIGRINLRGARKSVDFVVAWFLDTRDL